MAEFLHDASGIDEVVSNIEGYIENYEANIAKLNSLIAQIEASNQWKDATVKTAFLSTARAFISNFNTTDKALKKCKKYLAKKSKAFNRIEKQFS